MIFFFSHLISANSHHGCLHDEMQGNTQVFVANYSTKRKAQSYSWEKIRLNFDFSYILEDGKDPSACYSVGQVVNHINATYTCQEKHILSKNRKELFVKTMDELKDYLGKLLKVIPLTDQINLQPMGNLNLGGPIKNSDLHITFFIRPMDDATAGGSNFLQVENEFHRPIQGVLVLNPIYIPEYSNDEDSRYKRYFFSVVIHEIFHILGIAYHGFLNHHDYENPNIYPRDKIFCSYTTDTGKKINLITSPHSQIFAKKFYGVDKYVGVDKTCPPGIELEDGGNQGTNSSHPEGRLAYSDVMVSVNIENQGKFNRLTEISLALLMDTGNYKVDWKMGQPLVWGNPESIDGKPIKGFSNSPPDLVFPQFYLEDDANPSYVNGFDFKIAGFGQLVDTPDCSNNNSNYCKASKFYNPRNSPKIGSQEFFDYIKIKHPFMICPKGTAILPGNPNACGVYQCDGFRSFTMHYSHKKKDGTRFNFECNKKNIGQKIIIEYYSNEEKKYVNSSYMCVDPERFCRSVELQEMNFKNDPFDLHSTQIEEVFLKKELSKLQVIIIIVTIFIIFLAIGLFMAYYILYKMPYRNRKYKQSLTDSLLSRDL